MTHEFQDAVSLELGRRIAARLRASPALLEVARANLVRWSRQNAGSPSLLRCYAEWQTLLAHPVQDICELLCSESEEARRLRQNSPFVGILPAAEVWEIKKQLRLHAASPA